MNIYSLIVKGATHIIDIPFDDHDLNVKIDHDKTDHLYSYLTLRTDRELTTELNEWFCSGKHTAPFGPGTLLYWGRKP